MNSIAGTGKNRGKTAARDESTLRAGTQDALRNAILDGKFKAGQKLVERELCEFTGASRSILREALVSLEAKGLIEHQSYRGYRVARLSARKIVEIFELRSSLETQAAELFTERASDEEIATLNEALTELERCLVNFDLARMRATKERYYDTLFTGCRNEEIRRALANVAGGIAGRHASSHLGPDQPRPVGGTFRESGASGGGARNGTADYGTGRFRDSFSRRVRDCAH
jgi:DNA-binding GntR family transcriptional regulator